MHTATVGPIRVTEWVPELRARRSRVVAYRASCRDGWRGPSRGAYADAQADARHYNHTQRTGDSGALCDQQTE